MNLNLLINILKIIHQKSLNFAISLAIYDVLFTKNISKIAIKWPNDIVSANRKICGILVENTFKGDHIKNSVIGIGLNVNQENFPKTLTNVTSLKLETLIEYDLDDLLKDLLMEIEKKIHDLATQKFDLLEKKYMNALYKKDTPSMFKSSSNKIFMGMITGISTNGKIQIQLEDESMREFGIKEISFL